MKRVQDLDIFKNEHSKEQPMQEDLEDEVYFLARLRDRIVMQDCNILINENELNPPKK